MNENFDLERLAEKVIESLSVAAGQVIWIWASTHSLAFVEALAFRIRERGAFWMLRLTMETLLRRIGRHVPEPYLALVPEHELRWLDDVNAIIEVRDHGGHIHDVPLLRRRAMAAEWIALIDAASRRGLRRLKVVNPTSALAFAYNVPLPVLRQRYWQAVNIDYTALDQQQNQVAERLAQASQVHITAASGTDLRLCIEQRPIHLDKDDLPRGEVYVAPHETSAEGFVVINKRFIKGMCVEQLRLHFVNGRVAKVEAPDLDAAVAFKELLAASTGDKDVIAEFALGLNPGAKDPVGDVMLDEKIGGSAHIAIGMNKHFGGNNQSDLHLDMVILQPTIRLDGLTFMTDGILPLSAKPKDV